MLAMSVLLCEGLSDVIAEKEKDGEEVDEVVGLRDANIVALVVLDITFERVPDTVPAAGEIDESPLCEGDPVILRD